jgi:hypothetical protein
VITGNIHAPFGATMGARDPAFVLFVKIDARGFDVLGQHSVKVPKDNGRQTARNIDVCQGQNSGSIYISADRAQGLSAFLPSFVSMRSLMERCS